LSPTELSAALSAFFPHLQPIGAGTAVLLANMLGMIYRNTTTILIPVVTSKRYYSQSYEDETKRKVECHLQKDVGLVVYRK